MTLLLRFQLSVFVCILGFASANAQEVSISPFAIDHTVLDSSRINYARAESANLIKNLIKANPQANEDLVFGYWSLEHVYEDYEITSHWAAEGHWIKFYDDFTYQTGVFDDVITLGSYYYDKGDKMLLLLDANTARQPKLWRLALEGTDASVIGREYFEIPNGVQIKLMGVYKQPSNISK